MKEWIWWIQSNTDPCCYEWCIIWIDDGHEERVEWDIQYNENILIIDWVILIDGVCWGVPFWRNSVIYKHRLNIVIFISFDWCDMVVWRIDEEWERYEKWIECFSFHSSLCCLQCLMKWLFQSLCECFQHIHMNWSTPVTTCVWVMWNPPLLVIVDEMNCVRGVWWLLNTNPTHSVTLIPSILCLRVSVVMFNEMNLEFMIDWRRERKEKEVIWRNERKGGLK